MKNSTSAKLAAAAMFVAVAPFALAGKDKGQFSVVLPNGKVLVGKQKTTVSLAPGQVLRVKGQFQEFLVDGDTFSVGDQTLTSRTTNFVRTPIFALRVPLHGKTLVGAVSVELNNEQIVLKRSGGGITMKIQAKDISQGGMFQMEPSRTIDYRHTLASGFAYSVDQFGRVVLKNGVVTIRESPETASLKAPALSAITGTKASMWTVTAGGRMGMVVGEDAVQP